MNSLLYQALNKEVLELVPLEAKHVLDVGCGDGSLGSAIKTQRENAFVTGITFSPGEASMAADKLDEVHVSDLNNFRSDSCQSIYDCVVCSHVLEHVVRPAELVAALEPCMVQHGKLIIALPNVLFFKQRWQFLLGRFRYNPNGGLMDETHLRFFDFETCDSVLAKSNLVLTQKTANGMFPQPVIRRLFPAFCKKIDRLAVKLFPGLFALQFILIAEKRSS